MVTLLGRDGVVPQVVWVVQAVILLCCAQPLTAEVEALAIPKSQETPWLAEAFDPLRLGYAKLGEQQAKVPAAKTKPQAVLLYSSEAEAVLWRPQGLSTWTSYKRPLLFDAPTTIETRSEPEGSPVQIYAQAMPAAETVGDVLWARKLYNPADPKPEAQAVNGWLEELLAAGANRLRFLQWQGDHQGGGRGWGGNIALFPPSAALCWDLEHYNMNGVAADGRRPSRHYKQDAHLRLCYFDLPAAQLPMQHGKGFALDRPFPANAVIATIAFRHPGWNSHTWVRWGYSAGNMQIGSAVWQVAKGQTFYEAQKNPENRLASLDILPHLDPGSNEPVFSFDVQAGGHWQLRMDLGHDGVTDFVYADHLPNGEPSLFQNIDGRSGLLMVASCAGGHHSGRVGQTEITVGLKLSDLSPVLSWTGPKHPKAQAAAKALLVAKEKRRLGQIARARQQAAKQVKKARTARDRARKKLQRAETELAAVLAAEADTTAAQAAVTAAKAALTKAEDTYRSLGGDGADKKPAPEGGKGKGTGPVGDGAQGF